MNKRIIFNKDFIPHNVTLNKEYSVVLENDDFIFFMDDIGDRRDVLKSFEGKTFEYVTKDSNNITRHLKHEFYKDAESYRQDVRLGQIIKGSEKYPEPFTTKSWTNDEIVEHAMQENVDQAHYIYACNERMVEQEKVIKELQLENKRLLKRLSDIDK